MKALASSRLGFTLVELIVSTTIFAFILVSFMIAYTNIVQANKRLEGMRILGEDSRIITETLAGDIRQNSIARGSYTGTFNISDAELAQGGTSVLFVKRGTGSTSARYMLYKKLNLTDNWVACSDQDLTNQSIQCVFGKEEPGDSTPKILSSDQSTVKRLRFFISGRPAETVSNLDSVQKVTLILDLKPAPKSGITESLAKTLFIHLQTTISEKLYRTAL